MSALAGRPGSSPAPRAPKMAASLAALVLGLAGPAGADTLQNRHFRLEIEGGRVVSLRCGREGTGAERLAPGASLGRVVARSRRLDNPWTEFDTAALGPRRTVKQGSEEGGLQRVVVYNGSGWYDYFADLEVTERFRLEGDAFLWTVHFRNLTHRPVDLDAARLDWPFAGPTGEGLVFAGHGSYGRAPAVGVGEPVLVMVPLAKAPGFEPAQTERNFAPASLSPAGEEGFFVHPAGAVTPGGGRPLAVSDTAVRLSPKFTPGDELTYGFKFLWAESPSAVPDLLVAEGLFDVRPEPGSLVPVGRETTLRLRSTAAVVRIVPEDPAGTRLSAPGQASNGTIEVTARFARRGTNRVFVEYGRSQRLVLTYRAE